MRSPTVVSRPIRGVHVLHQRDVGGGAAHVEGEEVSEAGLLGDPGRAGDAAGRAGQQHVHRVVGRGRRAEPGRRRCAGSYSRPATPPSRSCASRLAT